ncbi:MAG: restriction endonuclease subunit M [Coprobacillaceae bacterium]
MSNIDIDIKENDIIAFYPQIMDVLLKDRTTNKNIVWATDDYEDLGEFYKAECEITINLITVDDCNIIQPRITKSQQSQLSRTKNIAEVFTPSWICNAQNNLIDNAWFNREGMFNQEEYKSWRVNKSKVEFSGKGNKTWKKYVVSPRMEITCGEAPYLVSRYDAVDGTTIPINRRIGLLDRKLRVVNENTELEDEWYKWTVRAFQSIYGFEFQGDNLLLARENLLYTFIDNLDYKFHRKPVIDELTDIANIISWNIWQMDGLKFTVPYSDKNAIGQNEQITLFNEESCQVKYCIIKDWQAIRWKKKGIIEYRSLLEKEV